MNLSEAVIDRITTRQQQELERRERLYRQNRPLLQLRDLTIILVDDGLATGATMRAAVKAIQLQQPAAIVVAVPVASPETYQELATQVDELVCAEMPVPFYSVGSWYKEFPQTTDAQVCELLQADTVAGALSPQP